MSAAASVNDLRAVSAADILKADPDYSPPETSFRGPSTFPNLGIVVDGYVVRREPVEVFASGNEHRVALLHGNTSHVATRSDVSLSAFFIGQDSSRLQEAASPAIGPSCG